jgi:site-specific recombinase XerD
MNTEAFMSIAILMPLWRAALTASGKSPRTISSYTAHMTDFAHTLGTDPTISAITPLAIASYQRKLASRVSPKTLSLALTAIRSFCRFLVRSELRQDDPTLTVEYPYLGLKLPGRALTPEQLRLLRWAMRDEPADMGRCELFHWRRNRRLCLLMLYTGARRAEAANMRWLDVQIDRRLLTIRGGKGNRDRAIPLHAVLVTEFRLVESRKDYHAVAGQQDGQVLTARSVDNIFDRWVPRLGLPFRFTSHQLRHSFCTGLIDGGANIFETQELMGHADPKTTRQYYRLNPLHLRGPIDGLPDYL